VGINQSVQLAKKDPEAILWSVNGSTLIEEYYQLLWLHLPVIGT